MLNICSIFNTNFSFFVHLNLFILGYYAYEKARTLSEITSQNHGFAVKEEDVRNNPKVEITHVNLNDNTIEGIRVKGKKAFSVQYHPESAPGPHDSRYLFDDFVEAMKKVEVPVNA